MIPRENQNYVHIAASNDRARTSRPKSRRRDQVKIITTPWTPKRRYPEARVTGRGGSPNGFTLGHRGHSSHQQGWRFCGSFKELRRGRLL
ncbi:uncharacterized protein N7459_004609 [Penicillium hispanicum]|uniref:uncharacterized protein n=1 Tax=Penicillium hispanicum TaxID=1080232 RepID=UPI002540B8A8|nr:uncharacterized protein N7459_004609 [Penicillium hispanicum]KAJ5584809.1 hypothetical protein N7459_004609 [Penicillium hispanicum]